LTYFGNGQVSAMCGRSENKDLLIASDCLMVNQEFVFVTTQKSQETRFLGRHRLEIES